MSQKTYYSAAGSLIVNISVGQRILENGQSKVINQKVAEFNRQPDGYGKLDTSDPEIIDVLDRRMKEQADVFDVVEYFRRVTPLEVQLREALADKARAIEETNRLAAKLKVEGKLVERPPLK